MGARGVGGGLGNSGGFLSRGRDVSKKQGGQVSRGEVELDGRLGCGERRKARRGGICVEVGGGGQG